MKKEVMLIALLLALTACSNARHQELARQYKLDLQYHDNAVKFAGLNMMEEAEMSCEHTRILRSECFTSLAQKIMSKGQQPKREYCDEINPEEGIVMTEKAYKMVYPVIDETLEKELEEKVKPSEQRKETFAKIKEECYQKAR